MKNDVEVLVPDELIAHHIYFIRGQKVMLDRDLAKLYEVQTKVLKQAVKRNAQRFPTDFMFELTKVESDSLRSQFATTKNCQTTLFSGDFKRNSI
jgi:hypothetical protein